MSWPAIVGILLFVQSSVCATSIVHQSAAGSPAEAWVEECSPLVHQPEADILCALSVSMDTVPPSLLECSLAVSMPPLMMLSEENTVSGGGMNGGENGKNNNSAGE